ncbi:MAG: stage V sporulation protein AE [Bacillota bacterium]
MEYIDIVKAFFVGGLICVIGQILIDKTQLTSGKILVFYVCLGCVLGGLGWYEKLVEFAGAGATVPLTGFGFRLAEGVKEEIDTAGALGIFTGGLKAGAGGITAAVAFGFLAALLSNPKEK